MIERNISLHDIRQKHLDNQNPDVDYSQFKNNHPFLTSFNPESSYLNEGVEHKVYSYGDNHVIKEAKMHTFKWSKKMTTTYGDIFTWKGIGEIRKENYDYMKQFYGEYLLDSYFIYGHSSNTGKPTNYVVQPKINGPTLHEMPSAIRSNLMQDTDFPSQILDILWASKRIMQEIGVPPDMKDRNLMYDYDKKKVYITDSSMPTLTKYIAEQNEQPISSFVMRRFHNRRLKNIEEWENLINPTVDEKSQLDERYKIDVERLQYTIRNIKDYRRKSLLTFGKYAVSLLPFAINKDYD